jgi:hypothetical protein
MRIFVELLTRFELVTSSLPRTMFQMHLMAEVTNFIYYTPSRCCDPCTSLERTKKHNGPNPNLYDTCTT